MSDKRCFNCQYHPIDITDEPCISCELLNKWKAKEMSDIIQISEEQAKRIIRDIFYGLEVAVLTDIYDYGNREERIIEIFKNKGYIKKSNLELARDRYYKDVVGCPMPEVAFDYIHALEKELGL